MPACWWLKTDVSPGGISGGCLEGDALRRARRAILAKTPAFHVYDTLDGEDEVIGIGLGCNGRIKVLFLPIDYHDPANELEVLRQVIPTREPRLFARLLAGHDSTPPPACLYAPDQLEQLADYLGVKNGHPYTHG